MTKVSRPRPQRGRHRAAVRHARRDQGQPELGTSSSAPTTTGSTAPTTARRSRTSTAPGRRTRRARSRSFDAGEPAILLGTDTGPNPAEYLLHALAACLTTSLVYVAAARGVRLTEVESTLEGDMDVRGCLGISDEVRNGFERIRVRSASAATRRPRSCARSSLARRRARRSSTWSPTACRSRSASSRTDRCSS